MSGYDRFVTLSEELNGVIDSIKRKLDRRIPGLPNGEERKRLFREMDGELDDCQRLLREMQTEADSDLQAPLSYRQQMNSQIRDFRSQLDQIRVQSNRLKSQDAYGSRRDGFGNNPFASDMDPQQAAYRSQLLHGRQVLERTSDSLGRSLAVAAETEQIGTDVIGELHTQREALESTRTRLEETNVELGRSRKIIQSMGRRIVTNKIFLIIIIVLECGILGGVVYWKYFKK